MDGNAYLTAAAIGHFAYEILQTEIDAKVWGNTSKGLFAVTDKKRILFISGLRFKGPLTININGKLPAHQILAHETQLLLFPNQIRIIESGLEIRIKLQTQVWTLTILNKMDFNLAAFINRSKLIRCEMVNQLSNLVSNF